MPHKLDKERLKEQILGYLAAHPDGLTGPDLREQLQPRVSQPTLSRLLTDLRSR